MKPETYKYYAENLDNIMRRERIILNNPVIMQGLGLAPLVVASTTMKNSVILAVAVLLLLVPVRVAAALLSRVSYFRFRGFTYAVTASIIYIGVFAIINLIYPGADVANVGLYLPLLVVEPIIIKRYERPQKERIGTAFRKGMYTALGFVFVLLIIGVVRECLGAGSIYGVQFMSHALLPVLKQPSGGFILLGILMAVWRAGVNVFKKKINMGAKRNA